MPRREREEPVEPDEKQMTREQEDLHAEPPGPMDIAARASTEHKIHQAKSLMNVSVGTYRYRAFCSCGWVSDQTEHEATYEADVAAHLEKVT